MNRVLGLDYGSRRIGVALSDPLGLTAQFLPPIARQGDAKDIETIARAVREHGVARIVIGLPLLENGEEGPQARKVRRFAAMLAEATGLPVDPWDERFTTAQAERHLVASGVRREKRREARDSLAAAIILQSALDAGASSARNRPSSPSP